MIVITRFIFAHGASWTCIISTIRTFLLAVDAGISWSTLASVSLREIYASSPIITGLRRTFVDINFAASSREASGTEALNSMTYTINNQYLEDVVLLTLQFTHWYAKTSMLTSIFGALNWLTLIPTGCTGPFSFHISGTFVASDLSRKGLIEISWA